MREYKNDYRNSVYNDTMLDPIGPVGIITEQIDAALADQINYYLVKLRKAYAELNPELTQNPGFVRDDYTKKVDLSRFLSGEGKALLQDSVRGHDLYIFTDVLNLGQDYVRYGSEVSISPDEHFSDLIRIVQTARASALRINVIMPYLYEGRRYRRAGRESLDCSQMLHTLFSLGIDNFITFDAHDGRIANAVPRHNFEAFPTSMQITRSILKEYPDINLHPDHFMIVSPDENAISRCIFFATTLRVPLGIFYRHREFVIDYNKTIEKATKKFLGPDVAGKDVLLADDLLDTGFSFVDCASYLKAHGAKRVFCAASFAQCTHGLDHLRQAHASGIIEAVFATDLAYRTPALRAAEWYHDVPMANDLASLVDALNHDASLSALMSPAEGLAMIAQEHQEQLAKTLAFRSSETPEKDPRQLELPID